MESKLIQRLLIVGSFIIGFASHLDAQFFSYKQHIDKANQAYEVGNYLEAMIHYDKASEQKSNLDSDLIYKYADAAYNTYALGTADSLLNMYLETGDAENAHIARYRMAEMKMLQGQYDEAIVDFDLYQSEYQEVDTVMSSQIEFWRSSAQWALGYSQEYVYETPMLENSVNSPFSEHAPRFVNDELFFSALKQPSADEPLKRYDSSILNNGNPVNILGLESGDVVSHPAFTPDQAYVFFTVGEYQNLNAIRCELYYGKYNVDGSVSQVKRLPDFINRSGYTSTHPSISMLPDSSLILLYATNRAGGKGNLDIWYSKIDNDFNFSVPENLSAANTAHDDLSPYHHAGSDMLYFSSNGRVGYGGFDIYKMPFDGFPQGEVVNLGDNINSPNNDLYFFVTEDETQAYFTSNRPGSQYLENQFETCCYDIYKADAKACVVELDLAILNKENNEFIGDASIVISDKTTNEVVYRGSSLDTATVIELPCNDNLELKVSKPGFEDVIMDLGDLGGVPGQENKISKEVYLQAIDYSLRLVIVDEESNEPLNGATVYLTNKATGEVQELTNMSDNVFTFEIEPNTEYTIEVNKDGYKEEATIFTSGFEQSVTEKVIPLKLLDVVEKALISLGDAIPVRLYFDNDEPNAGAIPNTSTKSYTQTYNDYYPRKDKYKNIYLKRFRTENKVTANAEIEALFENDIKAGYDKYERFKNQLLLVLQNGQEANIYLRGFASPVAGNEYNTALGRRRIDSVRKEFYQWNGGVLVPYIKSGQLIITERSFGEETSPIDVSDNINAPEKSIYSPEASRERRVEIDEIQFNQNQ